MLSVVIRSCTIRTPALRLTSLNFHSGGHLRLRLRGPAPGILKIKGIPVQRAHCRELVQSHFEAEQKAHVCAFCVSSCVCVCVDVSCLEFFFMQ